MSQVSLRFLLRPLCPAFVLVPSTKRWATKADVVCCKMFASEMVGRIADRAVQIYGGAGYMEDYGIERFYRDVRLFRIYEGTTQIQQIIIARNMISEASA